MTNTSAKRSVFKDPLVHFLIAGFLLFMLLNTLAPDASSEREIVVDRQALLTFIQYRTKVFQPQVAAQRLDPMSSRERQNLIDDYVEEEAMYRQAISMGLEGDDYVIRRRMVQKLEFITQGFVEQELTIDDDALASFFQANKSDYFIEPSVTFTHVFVDAKNHTQENLQPIAQSLLKQLLDKQVSFSEAIGYGDRFAFHINYVERTPDLITSHFGESFSDVIFALELGEPGSWYGPFRSNYGLHLINVKQRTAGRLPVLEEVRDIVGADYRQAMIREHQREAIDDIVALYSVIER